MHKEVTKIRKLKKAGDYTALGWLFWNAFLLMDRKTKTFKAIKKEYDTFTKKEQKLMENV